VRRRNGRPDHPPRLFRGRASSEAPRARFVTMRRWIVVLVLPVLAGCANAASGAAGVQPSASVTTAVQGWEHWFRLEWTAQAKGDRREIDGYVYNSYGRAAAHMQMLAQALDASGNVVTQKIEWV